MYNKKCLCNNCKNIIAYKNNENDIILNSEVTDVERRSTYILCICPVCNNKNYINGFLSLDNFNYSTLEI